MAIVRTESDGRIVMPAQAGIHPIRRTWIPAYAGMTENEAEVFIFNMLGRSLLLARLI